MTGLLDTGIFQPISAFFAWWFGELAALIPSAVRKRLVRHERVIAVDVDAHAFALSEVRGEAVREIGRVERHDDAAIELAELSRLMRKTGRARRGCALRLGGGQVLRDRIHLPLATEENLHEVVRYQLDRLTPFSPEEVYFDCRVLDRHSTAGTMAVDLAVAPRPIIAQALAEANARGLRVGCVTYAGEEVPPGDGINLLPLEDRPPPPRGMAVLNAALMIVMAGLIGLMIAIPMERDRRLAEALEQAVERERVLFRTAESRLAERESTMREASRILERKRRAASVTVTLDRLTRLLPDDTWLTQFRLRDGKARIVGQSPSSSRIIGLVEGSPAFGNARTLSAARRNPGQSTETFQLEFTHQPDAPPPGEARP